MRGNVVELKAEKNSFVAPTFSLKEPVIIDSCIYSVVVQAKAIKVTLTGNWSNLTELKEDPAKE